MDNRHVNNNIRCRVNSCSYHCEGQNFCSLDSIQVDPCVDCKSGNPADESMCASYRKRSQGGVC